MATTKDRNICAGTCRLIGLYGPRLTRALFFTNCSGWMRDLWTVVNVKTNQRSTALCFLFFFLCVPAVQAGEILWTPTVR